MRIDTRADMCVVCATAPLEGSPRAVKRSAGHVYTDWCRICDSGVTVWADGRLGLCDSRGYHQWPTRARVGSLGSTTGCSAAAWWVTVYCVTAWLQLQLARLRCSSVGSRECWIHTGGRQASNMNGRAITAVLYLICSGVNMRPEGQ